MNILTETADNSFTLFNTIIGENYHSKHGAVQESRHVFIEAGLKPIVNGLHDLSILEVGFGTGLNFLLTSAFIEQLDAKIYLDYVALELFPLTESEIGSLDYAKHVPEAVWHTFSKNYVTALSRPVQLTATQTLQIIVQSLQEFPATRQFDLIYFDAFSVRHQPEMWTDTVIAHTCAMLKPGGIFVTYAITGNLKRALKAAGCTFEKLPGPPGKREMLRAKKL